MMLEKKIKAINERLADFERKGFTHTKEYKSLTNIIEKSGLKTTLSKSGNIRISRGKSNLENKAIKTEYGNKMQTEELLDRILKKQTLGDVKKRAKESLKKEGLKKPSEREITERINKYDEVRQTIEDRKSEWYLKLQLYANNNSDSIQEAKDIIHKGLVDITSNLINQLNTDIDEYLEDAPDYIKQALEEDI